MSATSRELVHQTLAFADPARVPQDIWILPIATLNHPEEVAAIRRDFPPDITSVSAHERTPLPTRGDMFALGEYVDEWGCTFYNIQEGVIGEVKDPLVKDWATDRGRIHLPRELLTLDRDAVNRDCAATDQFVHAGFWPRPFEQLQFIRGTEELYMDLVDPPREMLDLMREMHALYCETLLLWAKTDVDALRLMDDWGSQRNLLISPKMWRELFKPLYRDYAQIAHSHGKKLFMHSDGQITSIYPDLIEIGIDAINSQVFCMTPEILSAFAGKITFWGEMDRQHRLPSGTPADIEQAVDEVHRHLWRKGGCIAQCEFGPAARPENVRAVYTSWRKHARSQDSGV